MNQQKSLPIDITLAKLVDKARAKIELSFPEHGDRWLFVHVQGQKLAMVGKSQIVHCWPVSTALAGVNNLNESGGTPPGLHRILQKIGAGGPFGEIFENRQPTGKIWNSGNDEENVGDLILTRILTLDGQEKGVNRGPGIDSRERYIYIHGTNQEKLIGRPVSHGCVRMTNHDVLDLFSRVEEGDPVVIA